APPPTGRSASSSYHPAGSPATIRRSRERGRPATRISGKRHRFLECGDSSPLLFLWFSVSLFFVLECGDSSPLLFLFSEHAEEKHRSTAETVALEERKKQKNKSDDESP